MWKKYLKEIRKKLSYYAAFPPCIDYEIGDILVKDKSKPFKKESDLKKQGIDFTVEKAELDDQLEYISKDAATIDIGTKAELELEGDYEFGCRVKFQRDFGIVLKIDNYAIWNIEDKDRIKNEIKKKYKESNWDPRFLVVTELWKVQNCTVIIGESKEAKIEINFKVEPPGEFDLASFNVDAAIKKASSGITKHFCRNGLTPLFDFIKLKWKSFNPQAKITSIKDVNMYDRYNVPPFEKLNLDKRMMRNLDHYLTVDRIDIDEFLS